MDCKDERCSGRQGDARQGRVRQRTNVGPRVCKHSGKLLRQREANRIWSLELWSRVIREKLHCLALEVLARSDSLKGYEYDIQVFDINSLVSRDLL